MIFVGRGCINIRRRYTGIIFCSRKCLADFSSREKNPEAYNDLKDYGNISEHMKQLNAVMNPSRMDFPTRAKLSVKRRRKWIRKVLCEVVRETYAPNGSRANVREKVETWRSRASYRRKQEK